MAAHAVQVIGAGRLEDLAPAWGDPREQPPCILLTALPLDQPASLQPVDESGEAAAAEQEPLGELAHPHSPALRVGKEQQDLVGAEGEVVSALKLLVENGDHLAVRAQESPPCGKLAAVQRGGSGGGGAGTHRDEASGDLLVCATTLC